VKLVNETRKILNDDSIRLTATIVRVPVIGGHSESWINIEFDMIFILDDVFCLLNNTLVWRFRIILLETFILCLFFHKERMKYLLAGSGEMKSQPNSLNLWIVADNLRKGAATNAVQIAECLFGKL